MTAIGMGAVARDTTAVVRRHFGVFATLTAAFGFVPAAILGVAFPAVGHMPSLSHPVHLPPTYWLAMLAALLVTLVGMFTIAGIAADPAEGGGRPLGATIVGVLPKIGKAIVAGLLLLLAYLIIATAVAIVATIVVVFVVLVGNGGATAAATPPNPTTIGAISVGLAAVILLIILWLYARLTPLLGVLLREPISASAAIRRAWSLSRGSTWPIIGLWVGFLVVSLGVQAALWAAVAAVPASDARAAEVAGTLLRSAVGACLGIYFYAGCAVVYRHLAERPAP